MVFQAALSTQMLSPTSQYGFFETFTQEVRDNIYDLLYQERHLPTSKDEPNMLVRVPRVTLRLVSRQFKLEYDERIFKTKHLTALEIRDTGAFPLATITCPTLCTHTTNVKISLYACHDDHYDESLPCDSFYRLLRLDSLVKHLPNLRGIRVSLGLAYEDCLLETLNCLRLIADMPKVVDVTLRHDGFRIAGQLAGDEHYTAAFGTWTKQRGFEYDFHALKLCRESGGLVWLERQVA